MKREGTAALQYRRYLVSCQTNCLHMVLSIHRYVRIETDGSMLLCGGKELGERYLLRLIHCMEKLFLSKNKVVPSLVSDVDQYVFKVAGMKDL